MSDVQRVDHAVGVLEAAIALALLQGGWRATVGPGEHFRFSKSGRTCQPVPAIAQLLGNRMAAAAWVALVTDLGIADVDLGELAEVDTCPAGGKSRMEPPARSQLE